MMTFLAALARLVAIPSAALGLLAFAWVGMMVYFEDTGRFMTSVLTAAIVATVVAVGFFVLGRVLLAAQANAEARKSAAEATRSAERLARRHQDELDAVIGILRVSLSDSHVLPQLARIGFSTWEQDRLGMTSEGKAGWLAISVNTHDEIFSAVYAPSSGGRHTTLVEAQSDGRGRLTLSAD